MEQRSVNPYRERIKFQAEEKIADAVEKEDRK